MSVYKVPKVIKKSALLVSALTLLTLPVVPALNLGGLGLADASTSYTTLSSFSGFPGANLVISGGNFAGSEAITVVATQNGAAVANATTTSKADGTYSVALNLPAKLAQGAVLITATGKTSGFSSSNNYYVTPFNPSLTASSTDTTPYSNLVIGGSGYAPNETVDLNLAGATTTAKADASGAFKGATLVTPNVPAASYTIIGAGEASGAKTVFYEYVNGFFPSASPTSYYVLPATSLGFTGNGFAPGETVTVTDASNGTVLSSFKTDAKGAFTGAGAFNVPTNFAGLSKKFVLTGGTSKATTSVSTTIGQYFPNVSPTAFYIQPGKSVAFNGSGFVPGESVDIFNGTTKLSTVVADAKGNLTAAGATTPTPAQAGSVQTYTLTGQTSKGSNSVSVQIGSYNAQASPSGYYVMPGTVITFSGSGYAPSEIVTIFNGNTTVGSFAAGTDGSFLQAGAINVAYSQANTSATYKLVGATSNQPISFTIGVGALNTQLSPSDYYVLPFTPFSASATGFAPGEVVNLTNGTTKLGTATANAKGTASFTNISLAYTGKSSATLTATGVTSLATATASIGLGSYNATVTASDYYAKPGSTITLTGSGFAPSESVTVTAGTTTKTVAADTKGGLSTTLVLPFGLTKNSLDIVTTGALSHASSTTTITLAPYTPQVAPSTYYATPGTPVSFTGSGFLAGETIKVTLNGAAAGTETADAKGNLKSTGAYTLPYGKTADFVLTGATSGGSVDLNIGLAQFYAGIQLSSYYGNGGSVITVTGSGFAPVEPITLMGGPNGKLGGTASDSKGNFSSTITVPYLAPGKFSVTAVGGKSGSSPTTSYTIAQVYNSVGLGNYAVPAGKAVTITGSGFFAGEPVTVTSKSTPSYSFTADNKGNLNDSGFVLPANLPAGNLTITITGTESFTAHDITFYVQSPTAK